MAGPPARAPGADGPPGLGFPPSLRIRRAGEIRELHRRGKRRRTAHLDVFFAASPVSHARYGVVVPKHRRRVVDRNRLRRRLREIGRTRVLPRLAELERAVDVLVRARPEAYEASWTTLVAELTGAVEDLCSEGS